MLGRKGAFMPLSRISPAEARTLLDEGYVYVDVRSEPEFEESHPTGAYNVPLLHMGAGGMTPNPDFLAVMKATFPTDAKIVVGCKAGGRSLKAANALLEAGYTNVVDQRAGFDGARDAFGAFTEPGWKPAGLPVESGKPAGRSYADLAKKKG
jgi:rhodanese-related sulfurtransferase